MKFLIDMPVSPSLSVWLTEQGHEAIHVSQIGMASADDTDIMERVLSTISPQEIGQSIVVVDKSRIRKTRLPIK